jgi:hypothetical protein
VEEEVKVDEEVDITKVVVEDTMKVVVEDTMKVVVEDTMKVVVVAEDEVTIYGECFSSCSPFSSGRGGGGDYHGGGGRGGGGGGLTGRNRHMGELDSVKALSMGPGNTDRDILAVIAPPVAERNRQALVNSGPLSMPSHHEERMRNPVGNALTSNPQHIVRANHFKVDFSSAPGSIYRYHIHFYPVLRDGTTDKEVGQTEDSRILVGLVNQLRKHHPEWEAISSRLLGYAYDGRSTLFTSENLRLSGRNTSNEPFLEERVGIMNDG